MGVLALSCGALGCGSRGAGDPDAGRAASSASSAPPAVGSTAPGASAAGPAGSSDYEEETSTRPVELLKFRFTSGVKAREPVDELRSVAPGERVYAYLTLRNRTGRARQVHVEFAVNGESRTVKDLDVAESWSYRTWVYNTVLKKDKPGKLSLVVTDDEGHPLVEESLPIVAK